MLKHLTKRYFQLTLLCFICVAKGYSQTASKNYGRVVVEITKEKRPKRIYTKAEITSAFPGGDSAWVHALEERLNSSIPVKNGAKAGKYFVAVRFIVAKDGSLADVESENDPGFGMRAHVVRAIKASGKWGPCEPPCIVRPYKH